MLYYPKRAKRLAQKVDNNSGLSAIHGGIDGVYIVGSFDNYCFDAASATDDIGTTRYDQFLQNPTDLPLIISTGLFLSIFSTVAQHKKYHKAAVVWSYLRDGASGLKNGRHAVINSGSMAKQFVHQSCHVLNPIGIAIGVVLAINLFWYRRMNNKRQEDLQHNKNLKRQIEEGENLSDDSINEESKKIKRQSKGLRAATYASAFFDGITDGAYLYGCLFVFTGFLGISIPPAGFALIAAISVLVVISTVCKIIEEHKKQKELEKSADQCELKLAEKKVENIEKRIKELKKNPSPNQEKISAAESELAEAKKKVEEQRAKFNKKYNVSKHKAPIFYEVFRESINGTKNSKMAGDFCGLEGSCVGIKVIKTTFSMLYALYLSIRGWIKGQEESQELDVATKNNSEKSNQNVLYSVANKTTLFTAPTFMRRRVLRTASSVGQQPSREGVSCGQ